MTVTELVVTALGIELVLRPAPTEVGRDDVAHRRGRTIAVAATVGLLAGLLANAGGFLLVPLHLGVGADLRRRAGPAGPRDAVRIHALNRPSR